jgi:hypothetical protein
MTTIGAGPRAQDIARTIRYFHRMWNDFHTPGPAPSPVRLESLDDGAVEG